MALSPEEKKERAKLLREAKKDKVKYTKKEHKDIVKRHKEVASTKETGRSYMANDDPGFKIYKTLALNI
jgi:hypothetical protein